MLVSCFRKGLRALLLSELTLLGDGMLVMDDQSAAGKNDDKKITMSFSLPIGIGWTSSAGYGFEN